MSLLKKISDLPKAMKASLAFFLSSLITKGIAYITTPLYTRLLTADEFGQVSVFLTWQNIFGIIAMFSLMNGVFNNGMVDYPEARDDYSFSILVLSNVITVFVSVILFISYPFIHSYLGIDRLLLLLMCFVFLLQPAYSFWNARQRYELKYKASMFWSIFLALFSPLVAFICILNFQNNRLYARIFGSEIVMLVVYLGFYVYLALNNRFKINTKYWKEAFLFNLPLIPHYLSSLLLSSSDKLMISNLVGNAATAYYSVAYSVAAVATIAWTAVNVSLTPYTYEKCKEKKYEDISKVTLPIVFVFACICLMIIMLAPEVIAFMGTSDYMEAIYVIPPVVGGVFFQVQYYIYANLVYYYKKPVYVMIASLISTFLNIVLNYIFIKKYGYIAAGYTTLLSYLLQAAIDYLAMKKVVGSSVYNMTFIAFLSFVVVLISLFSNRVYDSFLVRYAILSCILIIAFVFRDKLIRCLKFN